MANRVWHTLFNIEINFSREDLGQPGMPGLWDLLYQQAQDHSARRVPVRERGLQCAGVCRDRGVVAWMYVRQQANGRREAVHEHAEDAERHTVPMSDEHKAYQERIVRTAQSAGFSADTEVRTGTGRRGWVKTDTLVDGADGRKIGWEVQLSSTSTSGPRSVRARAKKAAQYGIIPAWHTDRMDFAHRNDTQWTRSNKLPAYVIAKTGDLRVISGFRALDIWRCDRTAVYPCPNGRYTGCGQMHATPKPRDIFFDDLVRKTAAGLVVPIEHLAGRTVHRFWVTRNDQERYYDAVGQPQGLAATMPAQRGHGSQNGPTCRPQVTLSRANVVLDWTSREHWSDIAQPCGFCRKPTNLVDDWGAPAHKVCREEAQERLPTRAP